MLTVGVVGAGTMGSGIAQVAIAAGENVKLFDPFPETIERGRSMIDENLNFLVSKGKLTAEESTQTLARLEVVDSIEDLVGCDLVIEAIIENESIKKELFRNLETIISSDAILATNTSSISITALSNELNHPERLVGMHFFNPAPRMKLVEVIRGLRTSEKSIDDIVELSKRWGKAPVTANSTPGFIVNRVARPFYGEALRVLMEKGIDHSSLDRVVRECGGFPLGPCQLMDLIGLDVNLSVTQTVYEATAYDPRYAPSLLQQELVRAGKLGRKTGEGFYTYPVETTKDQVCDKNGEQVTSDNGPVGIVLNRLTESLKSRLFDSGYQVIESTSSTDIPTIAMSDGRTATQRSHDESIKNLILIDLCVDFKTTKRLALTHSAQCTQEALDHILSVLQKTGFLVTVMRDIAGMILTRTIAMLANEAADLVHQEVTSPKDVDMAMTLGTGYPLGPLSWADKIGLETISEILTNLCAHYGSARYRVSPILQRKSTSNELFHGIDK